VEGEYLGDVGAAPNWRPMWDFVETWGEAELWEMLERVARRVDKSGSDATAIAGSVRGETTPFAAIA
jgi:hypothetical protein